MSPVLRPLPSVPDHAGKVRVLVVDDSLVIRGVISRFLKTVPEIEVIEHRHWWGYAGAAIAGAAAVAVGVMLFG